jgi:hypothetical protein
MNPEFYKISCPNCGGGIEFPEHGLGSQIECPHCRKPIVLKQQLLATSRISKQKLVFGMLAAMCLAAMVVFGWNKFSKEKEIEKAKSEICNQFAFQLSSLITTLKDKSSLQYGIPHYLSFFDTNYRMYGGALSNDEQKHLNKLIDELQSAQFFAKKSDKEGMFADLSDEDKQMINHCDLSSNTRVWFLWLTSFDKKHPLVQIERQTLIHAGFDPDSTGGFQACSSYIDSLVAKAKAEKTAYNATACLDIMVERSGKSAGELFNELTK